MPDSKFTLQIPYAEKSHEFIFAFLRTSHWGEWTVDPEKKGDAFVLNFRRGLTHFKSAGFFGLGASEFARPRYGPDWSMEEVPLYLRVTIRPSPTTLDIGLHYHSLEPYGIKEEREAAMPRVEKHIFEEVRGLSDYLRDVYDLDEPPGLSQA